MKKNLLLTFLLLLCSQISWADRNVAMLICSETDPDVSAARTWFDANNNPTRGELSLANLKDDDVDILLQYKVIWVYMDGLSDAAGLPSGMGDDHVTKLAAYVKAGGNLLVTGQATKLVNKIGRGPEPNEYSNNGVTTGDTWGVTTKIFKDDLAKVYDHSIHPLYKNLTLSDGIYNLVSSPTQDHNSMWKGGESYVPWLEINYNCVVLGTWQQESSYKNAGIVEFQPMGDFKGRVLAIGVAAYQWYNNPLVDNVKSITQNAFDYLLEKYDTQFYGHKKVAYLLPANLGRNDTYETAAYKTAALDAVDQDDEKTALKWFIDEIISKGKGIIIEPKDLADLDPNEITTVWVNIDRDGKDAWLYDHGGEAAGNASALWAENIKQLLHRYVANAGNLLLTKSAVQLSWGMGRTTYEPWTTDGRAAGGTVGIKNNEDPWSINAVIGGGYVGDATTDGYTSYYYVRTSGDNVEPETGHYNHRTPDVNAGNKNDLDHRDNGLYFNMETVDGTYPVTNGYVTIPEDPRKYQVINIVGPGVREDHNCLWVLEGQYDEINALEFQTNAKCEILGQWGHKSAIDNAAIVRFKPDLAKGSVGDGWEGQILTLGLGAYEWQPSNADGTAREGENPYLNNIKQLTYNALNILEGDNAETNVTYYYGGVKYTLTKRGILRYATIEGVFSDDADTDPALQVYDITAENGRLGNGQIADENGYKYNIISIAAGAFTACTNLAYADLMKFQGFVPSGIGDAFHGHTLIYLPLEDVSTIDKCAVTGTNIINTLKDGSKVCKELKIYDNKPGGADTNDDWVYYWWANKYPFTAKAVSFTRTFTANKKSTVALPFAISSDELSSFGAFYRFDRIVDGDKAKFYPVYATEAYKPYMIIPGEMSATEHKISISDVNKEIQTFDFVNNYGVGGITWNSSTAKYNMRTSCPEQYYAEDGDRGANFIAEYRQQTFDNAESQGIFAYRDGTYQTTIGKIYADPYRGYVKLTNPSGARVLQIVFEDDEVTGIANIEDIDADKGCYYTLSGVKVANPTRGIYLKNGKKVIVK